jgi:hypothetical protein
VELIFVPGSHSFGLGESNARRREYLEQPLELIAVADFGIGTRRNGVR